jgi:hypothetical protein
MGTLTGSEIRKRRVAIATAPLAPLQFALRCWGLVGVTLLLLVPAYSAETVAVTIVNRQYSSTQYSYVAPAEAVAESNTTANCSGNTSNVGCYATTRTTATSISARTTSYSVRGATLTLQLADGRIVVVNCVSKYSPMGDHINARSCRLPMVNDIQAEFRGKNAKLKWLVSIDGKKTESETYKIVALLAASEYPLGANDQGAVATASTRDSGHGENVASTPEQVPYNGTLTDVMTWFDEATPGPTTEIRNVIITARGYDGVLNILSKLRDSDTSVKSGVSVLDAGYHPPSFHLSVGLSKDESVTVFHWDDETVTNNTLVMRLKVTRRVYDNVTNAVGHLRASTFTGK